MIETAKKAAKAAGKIILEKYNTDLVFEKKVDKSFVSDVDRECEQAIIDVIKENFKDHSINGEEFGPEGEHEYVWHIDPLDGTTNYRNKMRASGVSIGVTSDDEFILGVIYHPFTDELYYAEKGNGAFCNGKEISVNDDDIKEGLVFIDGSFGRGRGIYKIRLQEKLLDVATRFRIVGCTVMQMLNVFRGSATTSISDAVKTYDFAAGAVIVKEAGGIVSDQFGDPVTVDSKVIVASNNKKNHNKIIAITKEIYGEYNL